MGENIASRFNLRPEEWALLRRVGVAPVGGLDSVEMTGKLVLMGLIVWDPNDMVYRQTYTGKRTCDAYFAALNGPEDGELQIAVRIDHPNTVHWRLAIFTNSKRHGEVYEGRGLSGELTVDAELAQAFINRLRPTSIYWNPSATGNYDLPNWLREDARYVAPYDKEVQP